ncbi:hypothetical protein Q3G72_004225 [Acer saccharum]|nr:hypothetical protein Q3G72_004225 [Acer saccharum]
MKLAVAKSVRVDLWWRSFGVGFSMRELELTAAAVTEAVTIEAGERSTAVVGGFGEEIGGVFAEDVEVVVG